MSSRPSDFTLTSPGPLRLYSTEELLKMPPPEWLIDPIIPAGGLVGLYGPPGVGKSFLAIDMALSVACGRPWQGHPVQSGYVLYVSAEGGTGIGKRVAAWLKTRVVEPREAKVAWLTESIPVYSESADLDRLMLRISEEVDEQPKLVIIDTLARCFDGDENQQEDMGRFVSGVDKLRHEFGATLMVVHHTRLDGDRERGNTAFRGAADAMLSISRGKGGLALNCNKQKDSEEFQVHNFDLITVPGTDSCVIATNAKKNRKEVKLSEAWHVLRTTGPLTWDEWLSSSGLPRTTFHRTVVELKESGKIIREKGKWSIVGDENDPTDGTELSS